LLDGKPRAILFDSSKCIGCRQCVEACKDWNELPRGNSYRIGGSTWLTIEPPVLEGLASVWGRQSCMHCGYPVCAAVCPVEAITKYEEGPVVIDQGVCIGCEYCIHACPWHVIARDEIGGKARKCTMCHDRLVEGAVPFCVQACPVEALEFGLLEEMDARVARRAGELGATVYGRGEAGGTQVLHVLTRPLHEHGMPVVGPERFPAHHIPLRTKAKGLLTLTGGIGGKWRALKNALAKPWRLRYRYWQGVSAKGGNGHDGA
jgi:formate dehydrogenase iron-sulfur subunit